MSEEPQQQSVKRFVRLHAPFELLLELAEKTRMKLPIEVRIQNEKKHVLSTENNVVLLLLLLFLSSFF